MHFAWDKQRGKLISPSEAEHGRYYDCPKCYKQVTVRALSKSSLVTPYFAHLKHVANQDCENFFPSDYIPSHFTPHKPHIPTSLFSIAPNKNRNVGFSKNLYLINESGWSLKLILSLQPSLSRWDGHIDIDSSFGAKRIIYSRSELRLEVILDFNFSINSIKRIGNVDKEIWESITSNFDHIDPIGGVFHSPFGTGRKLADGERLRIGETYVLIPSPNFVFDDILSSISEKILIQGSIELYQFHIGLDLNSEALITLKQSLGFEIAHNKPEIKALNLHPLKIETDGTFVISVETKELRFECKDKSNIEIKVLHGLASDQIKYDEDLIIIDIANSSGIEIYWNHYPMYRISKGNTDFFNPFGLKIIIDQTEFDLLDRTLKSNLSNCKLLSLKSEWLQLSDLVEFNFLHYKECIQYDSIDIKDEFELNAEAFGYIYFSEGQEAISVNIIQRNKLQNKWLTFSGLLSKNDRVISNALSKYNHLDNKLNGCAKFHLMKLKNINKPR